MNYIPEAGDIVWIDFDPSSGHEINKRRPALVISKYQFNLATNFAVVCPITTTIKELPTRFTLNKNNKTKGQVIISQLKSLDFKYRKITFIEKIPVADFVLIKQLVRFIFD